MNREFENSFIGRVDVQAQAPSPEWVAHAVLKSVRLSSVEAQQIGIPEFRRLPKEEIDGFDTGNLEPNIISLFDMQSDSPDRILSVLLNSNIRRGNLHLVQPHTPLLREKIALNTRHANPIEIVLPTLPFKDQNPLTTRHSLDHVDMGEYLFIAQMRDIVSSVERTYPPGARITVLTDGLVYADIFANGEKEKINQYRENCVKIRDGFGLKGKVEILDMMNLVDRHDQFLTVQEQIRNTLVALEKSDYNVKSSLAVLRRGMLFNTPAPEYSFDEYRSIVNLPEENLPSDILERITNASFDYASFLLTMQHLDVIQKSFPNAIRATVHPKSAPQLPIHLANKSSVIFPYNGIPLVSETKLQSTGSLRKSTRIVRFYEVLQHPDARAVYIQGQDEPFYYEVSGLRNSSDTTHSFNKFNSEEEQIGGYFITDKIRGRLLQSPDHVVEDKIRGRKISVLFGKQRTSEDPPFSVYCLIINTDGSSSEIVAGGRTKDDALRGIGLDVCKLVKTTEQTTQDNKN